MERRTKVILLIIVTLIVALALVIILFASLRGGDNDPSGSSSADSTGASSVNRLPSVNYPVYEGKDVSSSPFVGGFKNTYVALYASDATDVFKIEEEIPSLTVETDGSFQLQIYDAEAGVLMVRGSATVNGETAEFTIDQRPEGISFLGVDVESFRMTLADGNNMYYAGEALGSISKGDVFTRTEG